jgi:hypothetical protein
MHIYNWYHSDITGIRYVHKYVTVYYRAIPLLSAFHFPISFCSPFVSLYLLGTLLAVIGSRPPRSQVALKLIFPFPSPYPYTPHSKIPTPRGLPDPNIHSLGRHREPGSQDPAHFYWLKYVTISQEKYSPKKLDMKDGHESKNLATSQIFSFFIFN